MTQTIKAIYQNGMFKPLEPIKIQIEEGQKVKLTIISTGKSEQNKSQNEEKNRD